MPLPSWYTPETPDQAAPAPPAQTPSWYEPEAVTVTADRTPDDSPVGDLAANVGTGLARIPGAIIGTPHVLAHAADWLYAKLRNMTDGGDRTGADVDQDNPIAKHTLSSEDVDNGVFKGVSAVAGREVHPYEPTSFIGRMLQAGITGAGAGLVDPGALLGVAKAGAPIASMLEGALPRMAKTAIASDAANETSNTFPDSPGLAAAAALLAHTGAGLAGKYGAAGYQKFGEPLVNPNKSAEYTAGDALTPVDNTAPGLANPSDSDLAAATAGVKARTDALGNGLDDYEAGGHIRTDLQNRSDALATARSKQADENYGVFRAQPHLPAANLEPFMSSPDFRNAIKEASRGSLARGKSPLTTLFDFRPEDAGEPTLIPNAAIPPDVLQRIKGALDDQVNSAGGNVQRGDLADLRSRYVGMLDKNFPLTYPSTRTDFAASSRPLDPLETGAPGAVLKGETNFGNRTYNLPQERIPDLFLKGKGLQTNYKQLVDAFGGDKTAAESNLRGSLIGKVQDAINPDGTLSTDAFNRAVKPYTAALNMYFPKLSQEFSTAKGAQAALDTMKVQEGLASDIQGGALRDNGLVTRTSALRWLNRNKAALTKSGQPNAVMRLQQIANALPDSPTAAPEAAAEAAPMIVGAGSAALTGGVSQALEGGVLGGITHAIPSFFLNPRLSSLRNAYSDAIEKAFTDPAEAQRLVNLASKRGGSKQSLRDVLIQAGAATPAATLAGASSAQQ